jgi:GrpB-like predicted nucleotidyltransferase (UPF0157 family)
MADEIEIVDYDPDWPRLFEIERAALVARLPTGQFLAIEHAGSTAIPGLAAKPIIDIFMAVASIEEARATLVAPIEAIDYVYWDENPSRERMFFVKGMPPHGARRTHHIHVAELRSNAWQRPLMFRDYLRRHADEAERYRQLKLELASRYRHDREAYTSAKDCYVETVMRLARDSLQQAY